MDKQQEQQRFLELSALFNKNCAIKHIILLEQKLADYESSRIEPPVMQKIAGIRWESRYSETLEDDKMGRWMRIGRINGMTVAIILKAKERFLIKLPNNSGDESLQNHIIATDLGQGMLEAEKYIAKYVSNFSA